MNEELNNTESKKIGVFYRHHSHQSINGSLFYALEYYFSLLNSIKREQEDASILNKENIKKEVSFYWIFPKKLIDTNEKINKFKRRLLKIVAEKYPINFVYTEPLHLRKKRISTVNSIAKDMGNTKLHNTEINYEMVSFLTQAIQKIILISESDLIKLKVDKSLFISQNTVHDCILKDLVLDSNTKNNFGKKYFILNREFQSLSNSVKIIWKNIINNKDDLFLYELPQQKILESHPNQQEYHLKLGVKWFWPKEIITQYNEKYKPYAVLYTGHPLDYPIMEENVFNFLDVDFRRFKLFMNWKKIIYNKRPFEENNRAIIEADYYNIPFEIINQERDTSDKTDSIYTRIKKEDYYLKDNDSLLISLMSF